MNKKEEIKRRVSMYGKFLPTFQRVRKEELELEAAEYAGINEPSPAIFAHCREIFLSTGSIGRE